MNNFTRIGITCCIAALIAISSLNASVPQLINAQGKLVDASGNPLPNPTYSVTFTIYSSPTGGDVIWTETNPSVAVSNGQFSVLLGSIIPINDAVFGDSIRYLGIKVGSDPEMTPRSRLVSVGYAQRVASISGSFGGEIIGSISVDNTSINDGDASLTIHSPGDYQSSIRVHGDPTDGVLDIGSGNGTTYVQSKNAGITGPSNLLLNPDAGFVGVGTYAPLSRLHVDGEARASNVLITGGTSDPPLQINHIGDYHAAIRLRGDDTDGLLDVGTGNESVYFQAKNTAFTGPRQLLLNPDGGRVGIGTFSPTSALHVVGTTSTSVLEITGGSDLAEPFETGGSSDLAVGSVVVIDEENPGMLKQSHAAYDTRVAGVVSGAGGIKPGLTLRQEGSLDQGQNIALSGRVYVLATAANGPIRSGDLLTTSDLAGHAMKATDRERWSGAVIGKAMTALESGEGLVLVLVNLQ